MKVLTTGLAVLALVVGCSSEQDEVSSAVVKRSLWAVGTAQEYYFADNGTYTTELELPEHSVSARVTTTILYADESGWIGTAQAEGVICARYDGWWDGEFPAEVGSVITDYGLTRGVPECKFGETESASSPESR